MLHTFHHAGFLPQQLLKRCMGSVLGHSRKFVAFLLPQTTNVLSVGEQMG